MLFIPVQQLQEGMILEQDVNFEINGYALLVKGQVLNVNFIKKLQSLNILGVYIESKISDNINVNSTINDNLKRETLTTIKRTFEDFLNRKKLTASAATVIMKTAEKLVKEILSNEDVLINLVELKGYDDYTYRHTLCVTIISISVGIKLGFNEEMLNKLAISGLLHDIGKMYISKDILNKPTKLTAEEFEIMKRHPDSAVLHLGHNKIFSMLTLKGIESHHEKYNGSGYPRKIKGDRIPLFGRILTIADVYDDLTSNRPHRKASFPSEVIEYMMGNSDVLFDQDILAAFLKSVATYPVGMLVTLSSGQTAIVVKNNEENTLRPMVRLLDEDGYGYIDIDLMHDERYYNLTISGMGYSNDKVNCNAFEDIDEYIT